MLKWYAWLKCEQGQGMVEYVLIIGFVVISLVYLLGAFGELLLNRFQDITNQVP